MANSLIQRQRETVNLRFGMFLHFNSATFQFASGDTVDCGSVSKKSLHEVPAMAIPATTATKHKSRYFISIIVCFRFTNVL